MSDPVQETPFKKALREHPPILSGTKVSYKTQLPGGTGTILGLPAGRFDEKHEWKNWNYSIVPFGEWLNGSPTFVIERLDTEIEKL